MTVRFSKTQPTHVWVLLHRFKNTIVSAEAPVFPTKEDAEIYIEKIFENDPALDYKDSFYAAEIVIDLSTTQALDVNEVKSPRN